MKCLSKFFKSSSNLESRRRKTWNFPAIQSSNFSFFSPPRMNHHHYQQRLNHQQIQQQQIPPPQLHGNRSSLGGLGQQQQHQVPPPIIPKQHLHQNIATLNQKPPQHVTSSSQNSQIQPTQRLSYESE